MDKSTDELMNILQNANDTQILDSVIKDLDKTADFHSRIDAILLERNISIAELQRKSCIDRTYIYQIMDGSRNPGRDKVIAICLALGIDVSETARLLKITGNAVLYPKNRRDAILIYALNNSITVADANRLLESYGEAQLN